MTTLFEGKTFDGKTFGGSTLDGNGCDPCGSPQLARNTWFTGKLLTERDLTDEQRYLLGKIGRHSQYLHGSGIVCGLDVAEHPNPACRTELVTVGPGLAIDCCGREILLTHDELVPLKELIAAAWAVDHGDAPLTGPHRVELCIAYRECLTEDVEALIEPCDDTGCRPNRILDSYAFGVRLDVPPPAPAQPAELAWQSTLAVAKAGRFAADVGGDRLYVLSGSTLMSFALSTGAVLGAITLPAAGLDVATSRTGDRVYVAVAASPRSAAAVLVLDAADLTQTLITLELSNETVPGGGISPVLPTEPEPREPAPFQPGIPPTRPAKTVRLAVPGTGGVLALDVAGAMLYRWDASVDSGNNAKPTICAVGADPRALVVLSDSSAALVTCGDKSAHLVKTGAIKATSVDLGKVIVGLAVVAAAGELRVLGVASDATAVQYRVDVAAGTIVKTGSAATLIDTPVAVATSSDGGWAVVAGMTDANQGTVRVLDVAGLNSAPRTCGPATPVGTGELTTIAMDGGRERVLVGYAGVASNPVAAGIAVLHAQVHSCSLEPGACPSCAEDCLVLATIENWTPGDEFVAATLSAVGRRHLPSVSQLAETIRCLLARPSGGAGERGPAGPTGPVGPAGPKGDRGERGQDGLTGESGDTGPRGEKGDKGDPGRDGTDLLAVKLPKVVGLSWKPRRPLVPMTEDEVAFLMSFGVIVVFNMEMDPATLDRMSCSVHWRRPFPMEGFSPQALHQWVEIRTDVKPCAVPMEVVKCGMDLDEFPKYAELGLNYVNAVQLTLADRRSWLKSGIFRVVLAGNLILSRDDFLRLDGTKGQLALDGNHLADERSKSPYRCPTGDLIEGGRYESWFMVGKEEEL